VLGEGIERPAQAVVIQLDRRTEQEEAAPHEQLVPRDLFEAAQVIWPGVVRMRASDARTNPTSS
jgi:hypothetical protein